MTLRLDAVPARRPTPPLAEPIGELVRAHRISRGLTIRALGEAIGVSTSLISQIEHGHVTPSVGRLYALATELDISFDELFGSAASSEKPGSPRRLDTDPPASRGWQAPSDGPVLRAINRPVLRLAGGVQWERLTSFEHPNIDFLEVVYDIGGESCPSSDLMSHEGEEFGLVLSGRLGATVGTEDFELATGDSIAFSSTTPHRFWTIGEVPTRVVWTVVGRANDPRLP